MTRKGPILTLAAGVGLAAVLMVLNLNATGTRSDANNDGNAAANQATTTAAAATATTAPPPAASRPPATGQVTYAGYVGGGGATLAIAIKDGKAIAYVCDGKKAEAWLRGTAVNGELALTGAGNARLTGSYGGGKAQGTVWATGKSWSFSLSTVKPPSGLYRLSANVRGAKVVGGWIVLANGTQVGVLTVDGQSQPAPLLDTASGDTEVDGNPVAAVAVDGTNLN